MSPWFITVQREEMQQDWKNQGTKCICRIPPCFYFWVLSGELVEMCNQVCRWHPCTRWESLIIQSLESFPELWSSFLSRVCWCLVILAWELGSELWEVSCILINSEYNLLGSLIIFFFNSKQSILWREKLEKRMMKSYKL